MPTRAWLLKLDEFAPDGKKVRELAQLLSADERVRRDSFRSASARQHFLLSRLLLRRVLGEITGRPPQALRFERLPSGKPELVDEPGLHFSLSHSGDWIALAVSEDSPVGVDIEQPRRQRDIMRIAHRYFHADECALLEAPPESETLRQFYRLWTLKEAFFKARGTGISEGLDRISFASFERDHRAVIDPELEGDAPWQFYYAENPLAESRDFYLAVAGQDPDLERLHLVRGLPGK
ncbi:4'-phosphopantetheinyl transferase family protein [Microbulbifer yueqingensis]|uniref:4'-phosphopantetheinyl transferase n=1 Tax=Microbulbifer yueqingensis TaxID=658219 RepID=A0A1G8Y1G5_9GAMM|nr:4'-phosphopantetheinyl transferase superfamily protein [Microbulbifer yueqingensis]SDJ96631.1 4'-phosphopantetheinyl transferase [Microbulbifer yueqingensis]